MPEAGDFPTRDTIAGQHRREHQVHDVWFRGAEAAGRGYDGNVVFVAQQEEIAGFDRSQEALDLAASFDHGAADHIVRTRGGGGGRDQDDGGLGPQQVLR